MENLDMLILNHALLFLTCWTLFWNNSWPFLLYIGKPVPDLQAFHNDVNKILNDIDRPINDDELSDVDEEELLVSLNYQWLCLF